MRLYIIGLVFMLLNVYDISSINPDRSMVLIVIAGLFMGLGITLAILQDLKELYE